MIYLTHWSSKETKIAAGKGAEEGKYSPLLAKTPALHLLILILFKMNTQRIL